MNAPPSKTTWVAVAIALAVCAAAGASESDTPLDELLNRGVASESVDVTVVNVDVVARGRSGRPVPLRKSDLKVWDNDERVEVLGFREFETYHDESEPLTILVFLDNLHLQPESRDAVLPEVEALLRWHLEEARSEQRQAMAVGFDGELRMLHDLTSDYTSLVAGLRQVEVQGPIPSQANRLKRRAQESFTLLMEQINGANANQGLASLESTLNEFKGYARVLAEDAEETADALASMIDSLALLPGRKAILLLSDGFAMRPMDRLLQNLQRRIGGVRDTQGRDQLRNGNSDSGQSVEDDLLTGTSFALEFAKLRSTGFQETLAQFDSLERFRAVAAQASANRTAFYVLKPPDRDAALASLDERVGEAQSHAYLSDLRAVLHLLAEDTGGAAMVSGFDAMALLTELRRDFDTYYRVSYVLDDFVDGEMRKIRVKGKRGMEIRHRTSYVARSLDRQLRDRTNGALLLGWVDNGHGLRIDTVEAVEGDGGVHPTKITVSVPLDELTLLEERGFRRGQVRCVAAVMTEDRRQLEPSHVVLPLQIPVTDWNEAKGEFFAMSFEFPLQRGPHKIAVGFWDENSGRSSFIRHDLDLR